jgi:uncharacterized protein YjbI with pentapeptide repeats
MSGFVSFLNVPPVNESPSGPSMPADPIDQTPVKVTPVTETDVSMDIVKFDTTTSAVPSLEGFETRETAVDLTGVNMTGATMTPVKTTAASLTPISLPRGTLIRRWTDAQDAHTRTEEVLRSYMWVSGTQLCGESDRFLQASILDLARGASLGESTVRRNLADLKSKLAIHIEVAFGYGQIKTRYRILSFKNLNQKRREAGLLWVIRRTTAVSLMTEEELCHEIFSLTGVNLMGVNLSQLEYLTPANLTALRGVNVANMTAVNLNPYPYKETTTSNNKITSSSDISTLANALEHIVRNNVDFNATRRIWTACIERAPDCTLEEIIEQAWSKAALCRSGRITNPIGFLIEAIPRMFEGPDAPYLRRRQEKDQQQRELEALQRDIDEHEK